MADGGPPIEQLIASARKGDGRALRRLFDTCRQPLLAELASGPGSTDGVASTQIVSETLEEAAEKFSQFDGSTHNHLLGWLSGILRQHVSSGVPEPPHFAHAYDATLNVQETPPALPPGMAEGDTLVFSSGVAGPAPGDTVSIQDGEAPSPHDATLQLQQDSDGRSADDGAADFAAESSSNDDSSRSRQSKTSTKRFGKYELVSIIAKGGMGVVYKARDTKLNRTVALKMILAGNFAGEAEVARFYAEAESAAKLRHPNIVAIHEFGEVEGQHFFSMDYIDGGGLSGLVRENALQPDEAASLVKIVAEAMHYAHEKGILHRDLKPSNVLVDQTGAPMITDFGLAKQVEGHSGLTVSGTILGTPSYMPPEQASGRIEDVAVPSDVYSIGAILYELLTGRPPFRAANAVETLKQVLDTEPVAPRLLNPSIPVDIETICLKCMQKEPAARYATAQELAEELERFQNGEPILARPIGRVARLWRWCRRRPRVAALAAAALLGVLVALTATSVGYVVTSRALTRSEDGVRQLQKVIDELYVLVAEEDLLDTPGLKPFRKKLLAKASEAYRQALEEQGDHPELREDLALSSYRLGCIMQELDRPLEALTVLRKARGMAEVLVDEARTEEHFALLGDIINVTGEVLEKTGKRDDAFALYDQAIEIRQALVNDSPNDAEYGRKLANARMNSGLIELGIALELEFDDPERDRRLHNALARCNSAQQRRHVLLEDAKGDAFLRRGLAQGYFNIGGIVGEFAPELALENFNKAIVQFDILLADKPSDLKNQYLRALCDVMTATANAILERPESAHEHFDSAVDRLKKLAADNPNVHEYQGALSSALYNHGILFADLQRKSEALESFRAALDILDPLAKIQENYQFLLEEARAEIAILEAE